MQLYVFNVLWHVFFIVCSDLTFFITIDMFALKNNCFELLMMYSVSMFKLGFSIAIRNMDIAVVTVFVRLRPTCICSLLTS